MIEKSTVAGFCLFVVGCAASIPEHLSTHAEHPQYPRTKFITSVGVSSESLSNAENIAKKGISEQVVSELKATTEIFDQETRVEDAVTYSQRVTEQIQIESSFEHAELIGIVTKAGGVYDNQYYAFAVLPRKVLYDELDMEYQRLTPGFREVAQSALNTDDIFAFTAAYRAAIKKLEDLGAIAIRLRAVVGRTFQPWISDCTLMGKVNRERVRRIAATGVDIKVAQTGTQDTDEGDTVRISSLVSRAVTLQGLQVGPQQNRHFILNIEYNTPCKRGSFGPNCRLILHGKLVDSETGQSVVDADLSDPACAGSSPRGEDKARRLMWKSCTEETIARKIKETLAGVLPLD